MTVRAALLFEYKKDGQIGLSGPGDVLRLAHTIKAWEPKTLLTTTNAEKLNGLFLQNIEVLPNDAGSTQTGPVNVDHLSTLLENRFGASLQWSDVGHAFIGNENPLWVSSLQTTLSGISFYRQRIDNRREMMRGRWQPPTTPACRSQTIAVAIRNVATDCERNTPDWFPELVRKVARDCSFKILWYGSVDRFRKLAGEQIYYGINNPFLVQIKNLRAMACCAVGWTSGALDLAAAAGIPILRVGEFQSRKQNALCDETAETRDNYAWGDRYNSYLACATNVGLPPRRLSATLFNKLTLQKSLHALMKHYAQMHSPKHVILPIDRPLALDNNNFKIQMWKHKTG